MDKKADSGRFVVFILLMTAVFVGNIYLMSWLNPPKKEQAAAPAAPAPDAAKPEEKPKPEEKAKPAEKDAKAEARPREEVKEEPAVPQQWVTLGSADPDSPYRMLVIATNRGAALQRVELNSPRIRDMDDRSGYLGHLVMADEAGTPGARVDVVGPGTPADGAGLTPGDVIVGLGGDRVADAEMLAELLKGTRPGQSVPITYLRKGEEKTTEVTLGWRPLELIKPEASDPLSFLMTLDQIDKAKLTEEERKTLGKELADLQLREGTWEVAEHTEQQVTFRRRLAASGLELTKRFSLEAVPEERRQNKDDRSYHLNLEIELRNVGKAAREVAYQLDGPTGLPIEGYWYASKVHIEPSKWSAVGLRDVVVAFDGSSAKMIACETIASDKVTTEWLDPPTFIGVDAQYFSTVLIPKTEEGEIWIARSQPIRVGAVKEVKRLTDVSFRLTSTAAELKPGGSLKHRFEIFAGPKRPELLAQYGLDDLVYYGWFSWVAKGLRWILHAFHAITFNYGIAILLLTVLVRLAMFPLSKKQALSMQKMQEIAPELKKIQEKYKNNLEQRNRAVQEIYRKYNVNPFSGCLVMFLQLPVFVALYRLLMVDVELRQAPLITEKIRWASNLAAPDMLFDWSAFWDSMGFKSVNEGVGFFGLGPYFNLLPIITVVLFLWQQRKMTPPPTDEQQAINQKVMQFMMIFIGFMFFKVASGLCVYFIASSLWGIAERKYLPKMAHPAQGPSAGSSPEPVRGNNPLPARKKNRDRRR